MKIAIFGLTACGKTYHCNRLANFFHLKNVSGSSILLKTSKIKKSKEPHFWIGAGGLNLTRNRLTDPHFDVAADKRILEIAEKENNIVVDSWTVPWLYKRRDLIRIYIGASLDARNEMAYLSTREKVFTKKILREKIIEKDLDNFILFKKIYNINLMNTSIFDTYLDISKNYTNPDKVSEILYSKIKRLRAKNTVN